MDNPFAPELLLTDSGKGVVTVTLNRPEAFNAANERLHDALIRVWSHLEADPAVRAVVLTGAGVAFSAGGDMEHFRTLQDDRELRRKEIDGAGRLVAAMVGCGLPVVAAVNGPAVGLGCNLAVLSDIVLIAEDTYLADPHVGVGLTAADGGAPTWPLLIGLLRAKEYLFTGDRIPAQQAVAIGLANRVVAGAELLAEAQRLAERLAAQPAHALRSTKKALNMHLARAVTGVLEYALAEEYASFDTPEHKAVVDGFWPAVRPVVIVTTLAPVVPDVADHRAGVRRVLDAHGGELDRWRVHHDTVEETVAEHAHLVRFLFDAGVGRLGWPGSAGGLGGDERHRAVLYDELSAHGLPLPEQYLPLETLGPAFLQFAPHLAAAYLPRYLRGEEWWGQCFSEPEAGSDLASLRCRAVRRGGVLRISGQKIWSSHGATAHRLVCLVRTGTVESRHRGLSMVLIDADAPGVTARPLALANGRRELAEVFLDDVDVPVDRLIGAEGQGWAVAMYLLQWERSMFAWQCSTVLLRRLAELRDSVADQHDPLPVAPSRLARCHLDVLALRTRAAATITRLAAGDTVGPEASVDKMLLAAAEQGVHDAARDLLGAAFTLGPDGPAWRSDWWYSRSATILGGSAEVQRGILADRVLGLPKS